MSAPEVRAAKAAISARRKRVIALCGGDQAAIRTVDDLIMRARRLGELEESAARAGT